MRNTLRSDRMGFRRRHFLASGVAAAIVPLLVACGQPSTTSNTAPTQAATAAPSAKSTSAPAAGATAAPSKKAAASPAAQSNPSSASSTGFTVKTTAFDNPSTQAIKRHLADFQKLTGMTAEMDLLAPPLYIQREGLELSSGSILHDAAQIMFVVSGQWIGAKWFTPLDPYIGDTKLNAKLAPDVADFLPTAVNLFTWNKSRYGLPFLADWGMVAYRKDIFDKQGVKPPETLDNLVAVAKKLNSKDVAGFIGRGSGSASQNMATWPTFLQDLGGDIFKNAPTDLTPMLTTPEAIKAADMWANLIKNDGMAGEANFQDNDALNAMQQGHGALWMDAFSIMPPLRDPKKSKVVDTISFALVPRGPAGRFPIAAAHSFGLPTRGKNRDQAWEFVKWATSKETLTKVALVDNYPAVPRTSVLTSADYKKKFNWNGVDIGETLLQSFKDSTKMAYRIQPPFNPIGDRIGQALQEVETGQKSAADAMKAAQSDVIKILQKSGYQVG